MEMVRGDTLIFPVNVVKAATDSSGPVPQPIGGWYFWCTLKRTVSDPDQLAVAQVTSAPSSYPLGGGISVLSAPSGQIQVTVPAIATRGFPDGVVKIVGDVQAQDTSGNIFTVDLFELLVYPDVTSSISAYSGGGAFPPLSAAPVPVVTSQNSSMGSPYVIAPGATIVEFDESSGALAVAAMPPNPSVGESHSFVWTKWASGSPPPVILGNGRQMTPYSQNVQVSGALVSSTAIVDFGASATWTFDGASWVLSVG